ncbi:hypothetical protein D0Y65_025149 [Glycine soja]|uniref:Uncharacterized protein n=1 Tax=Glycine soja TaxID=3848 RepID=A0A445J5I3_GLYSO|nr:hypothetical protein JHK87_026009 [Glycine soja]RZB93661.1 hypothetical protein D0Y65_025149 [Glycine soja]
MTSELSEAGMAPWPLIQHFFFIIRGHAFYAAERATRPILYFKPRKARRHTRMEQEKCVHDSRRLQALIRKPILYFDHTGKTTCEYGTRKLCSRRLQALKRK